MCLCNNMPRRDFLRLGGAALATAAAAAVAPPALADLVTVKRRSLAFSNLHTGQKLEVDYWVDGEYQRAALADINKVLRDWRTGDVEPIDLELLDTLNTLRNRLGSTAPFEVISGYRSPASNAMLRNVSSGVAQGSLHMQALAIDVRLPGTPLDKLHKAALDLKAGGVGYYPKSNFVHVDVGRVRTWSGS